MPLSLFADQPEFLQFFSHNPRRLAAGAVFYMLGMPLDPLFKGRIFGHAVRLVPFGVQLWCHMLGHTFTIRLFACFSRYTKAMYNAILAHKTYVSQQLQTGLSDQKRAELYQYHTDRVRDFQHERLIHLLVTFFFGFLLLVAVSALLLAIPYAGLSLPLGILSAILFVLELAYIRHYYLLENGVQSLYPISEQLR